MKETQYIVQLKLYTVAQKIYHNCNTLG